jgi:hypothetical protein
VKAIAARDEVALDGVGLVVFVVCDTGFGAVELVHLHVVGFVNGRQACRQAGVHQVAGNLGLTIDHDVFATREVVHVDAMARALEQQIEAAMYEAFFVHALADPRFIKQVHGHLLQYASADAAQDVIARLALNDDGVNAGFVEQLPQQQSRGACANDGNLGASGFGHACLRQRSQNNERKLRQEARPWPLGLWEFVRMSDCLCDDRAIDAHQESNACPSPKRTTSKAWPKAWPCSKPLTPNASA